MLNMIWFIVYGNNRILFAVTKVKINLLHNFTFNNVANNNVLLWYLFIISALTKTDITRFTFVNLKKITCHFLTNKISADGEYKVQIWQLINKTSFL